MATITVTVSPAQVISSKSGQGGGSAIVTAGSFTLTGTLAQGVLPFPWVSDVGTQGVWLPAIDGPVAAALKTLLQTHLATVYPGATVTITIG